MIPPKDCSNKEQAKSSPYPNIWISIDEELENISCGLHWAQVNSVNNFLSILNPLNEKAKIKMETAFKNLKNNYIIITQSKSHAKGLNPAAPSKFEQIKKWKLKDFNSSISTEVLDSVQDLKKKVYF